MHGGKQTACRKSSEGGGRTYFDHSVRMGDAESAPGIATRGFLAEGKTSAAGVKQCAAGVVRGVDGKRKEKRTRGKEARRSRSPSSLLSPSFPSACAYEVEAQERAVAAALFLANDCAGGRHCGGKSAAAAAAADKEDEELEEEKGGGGGATAERKRQTSAKRGKAEQRRDTGEGEEGKERCGQARRGAEPDDE